MVKFDLRADVTYAMKNEHAFESFGALSFDGEAAMDPPEPAPSATRARLPPEEAELGDPAAAADQFRAMLYERYTAPYALPSAYRHWGINE